MRALALALASMDGPGAAQDFDQVGDQAKMRGVVQPDGTVLAERLRDR